MKLNEQIAFLRKEKGITQEELANALGVSNQAVSKWENGQCCPDVQLLPDIARYFNVSLDQLFDNKSATGQEELLLMLRSAINEAANDSALTLRIAFALHSALLTKHFAETNEPGLENTFSKDIDAESSTTWGISGINYANFTTWRRGGSVFYSSNKNLMFENQYLRHVASVFRVFSDVATLKTFRAIYVLTERDEEKYVSTENIAQESGLSIEKTESILENEIYEYLREKESNLWGIKGCYMHLIPLMAMFGEHD